MMQFACVKNAFSAAGAMSGFSCASYKHAGIIILLGAILMASILVALISLRASLIILLALILAEIMMCSEDGNRREET